MDEPASQPEWRNHLDSAVRQMCIAEYHVERLELLLRRRPQRGADVPIAIQAHFDGALVASIAAADKVGQAVYEGLKLGPEKGQATFEPGFATIRDLKPVERWYRNPFGVDLRKIRSAHYSYTKDLAGVHFTVEGA